jgi:hypothetical protein
MVSTINPEVWRKLYLDRVRQGERRSDRRSRLKLVALDREAEATIID